MKRASNEGGITNEYVEEQCGLGDIRIFLQGRLVRQSRYMKKWRCCWRTLRDNEKGFELLVLNTLKVTQKASDNTIRRSIGGCAAS